MLSDKTKLFESNGVYSHTELEARHEIELEKYIRKYRLRAASSDCINHILPAAIKYQNELLANVNGLKAAGLPETAYASQLNPGNKRAYRVIHTKVHEMVEAGKVVNNIENIRTKKLSLMKAIKAAFFDTIRYHVDKLEHLVDDLWALPKYAKCFFKISYFLLKQYGPVLNQEQGFFVSL